MSQTANFDLSLMGQLMLDPLGITRAASEYTIDAWQRSVLYADIRRQRGNQYHAHLQEAAPNVLDFPAQVVMLGSELPRPVNYGLVRIQPSSNTPVDPLKRPFVVVDRSVGLGAVSSTAWRHVSDLHVLFCREVSQPFRRRLHSR